MGETREIERILADIDKSEFSFIRQVCKTRAGVEGDVAFRRCKARREVVTHLEIEQAQGNRASHRAKGRSLAGTRAGRHDATGLGKRLHHGAKRGLLVENGVWETGEAHFSPPPARA